MTTNKSTWSIISLSLLVGVASALNYIDRQSFGILAPLLEGEIGWTHYQYSWLVNAFTIAYGIGMLVGGIYLDRLPLKVAYATAIGLWSLAVIFHGWVGGFIGFFIVRFLLGFAEAANHPCAVRAASCYIPPESRSIPISWINSGVNIGAMFAPIILSLLSAQWGWRGSFILIGIAGFIWIPFWLIYCSKHTEIPNSAEESQISEQPESSVQILKSKPFWGFVGYRTFGDPCWYFMVFWLPKYFHEVHNIQLKDFSQNLFWIYFMATVGNIAIGWIAKRVVVSSINTSKRLYLLMGLCAACSGIFLLIPSFPELATATLLIGFHAAGHQSSMSIYFSRIPEFFGRAQSAKITAWTTIAGVVSGVAFANFIGWALDHGWTYHNLFLLIPAMYLTGYIIFVQLTRKQNIK